MPQRGWAVGYLRISSMVERIAVLERVDGHVLGAVVLEDAPDVRHPRDQAQVAEEDGDPDQALDDVLDPVGSTRDVVLTGEEQRQQEEQPTPIARVMPSISATEPLPSSTPSPLAWMLALRISQLGPDDEGLVQDDQAANERAFASASRADRVERLGGPDDVALGMAEGDAIASRPRIRTPSIRAWPP